MKELQEIVTVFLHPLGMRSIAGSWIGCKRFNAEDTEAHRVHEAGCGLL
jgi:hypothetical protein